MKTGNELNLYEISEESIWKYVTLKKDKKSLEINVFLELTLVPWFVVFGAVHALVDFLILRAKGEL